MAKRNMSQAEIDRRKKAQAAITRTTSTLGLGGVIATGAAIAAKKPKNLKAIQKIPGMKNTTQSKLKDKALYTSTTAGGIAGLGGYNFASYSSAEARQRKNLKKNDTISAFGVEH